MSTRSVSIGQVRWKRALVASIGPTLFLVAWSLLAIGLRNARPAVMPAPWVVAERFATVWKQGLPSDILASAEEAAGGWVAGCLLALIVGFLIGRIRWCRQILNPIVEVLRPVSALVWVPLAVVWFGIGYESKLFIVLLATFFVAVVHVIQGAQAADARHLKLARMMGLGRLETYRYILAPSAAPEVLMGLRQALAVSWGGVVIAELVAGNTGVGAMEVTAQQGYHTNQVVVGMVVFAVLGLCTVSIFGAIEGLALPWISAFRRGSMGAGTAAASPPFRSDKGGRRILHGIAGLCLLAAIWWAAAAGFAISPVVLPTPLEVLATLGHLLGQGSFLADIGTSLREFVLGYLLGLVTAMVAGGAFVLLPGLKKALWTEVELLRFVIPFSWIPLVVLWFSISSTGKVVVVWYAVFFSTILPIYEALARVDRTLMKAAQMLQLSPIQRFLQVRLLAALPGIAGGAQVGAAVGWISVIAAEYIGAARGLGVFITNAQETLDTRSVLAAMIVIGVIGALVSALARRITKLAEPRGARS